MEETSQGIFSTLLTWEPYCVGNTLASEEDLDSILLHWSWDSHDSIQKTRKDSLGAGGPGGLPKDHRLVGSMPQLQGWLKMAEGVLLPHEVTVGCRWRKRGTTHRLCIFPRAEGSVGRSRLPALLVDFGGKYFCALDGENPALCQSLDHWRAALFHFPPPHLCHSVSQLHCYQCSKFTPQVKEENHHHYFNCGRSHFSYLAHLHSHKYS